MTVPTPLTWSTWTAMQRRVVGHSMFPITPGWAPPLRVAAVIWAPVDTDWRAIWPTTCDGSVKAPGRIAVRLIVIVVSSSAVILVDRAMSLVATTTGPVVGGG